MPISLGRVFRTGWGQPGEYFEGALDDVRIYDRALSPAEIAALVDPGFAAAPGPGASGPDLAPASPNPFRRETRIGFRLRARAEVRLSVHDLAGREIARLAAGERAAGEHAAHWHGDDARGREVPAGVYFVRLVADPRDGGPIERRTRRLLRVR